LFQVSARSKVLKGHDLKPMAARPKTRSLRFVVSLHQPVLNQ